MTFATKSLPERPHPYKWYALHNVTHFSASPSSQRHVCLCLRGSPHSFEWYHMSSMLEWVWGLFHIDLRTAGEICLLQPPLHRALLKACLNVSSPVCNLLHHYTHATLTCLPSSPLRPWRVGPFLPTISHLLLFPNIVKIQSSPSLPKSSDRQSVYSSQPWHVGVRGEPWCITLGNGTTRN